MVQTNIYLLSKIKGQNIVENTSAQKYMSELLLKEITLMNDSLFADQSPVVKVKMIRHRMGTKILSLQECS